MSLIVHTAAANAYITPTAALVGALLVALIAAVTAERRLTKQLEAEGQRQAAQLQHEHEMADLSDLRGLLDEAVLALRDIEYAYSSVTSIDDAEASQERARCQRLLDALAVRLHVRLGPEDRITVAFAHAHSAARRLAAPATAARGARTPDAHQALTLGIDDLLGAAVRRAGVLEVAANGLR